MRPIPSKMREELAGLPRMRECAIAPVQHVYGACHGRVEWHHVWQYGGKQINELWAILGGCSRHHAMVQSDSAVRMAFEAASLLLATSEDLAGYPRKKWDEIKKSLGLP